MTSKDKKHYYLDDFVAKRDAGYDARISYVVKFYDPYMQRKGDSAGEVLTVYPDQKSLGDVLHKMINMRGCILLSIDLIVPEYH